MKVIIVLFCYCIYFVFFYILSFSSFYYTFPSKFVPLTPVYTEIITINFENVTQHAEWSQFLLEIFVWKSDPR